MALPKKGALVQRQAVMVDSTDFGSVESAITASDFNSGATVKYYGLNYGGSAATTSGTVSKIASLIRSGVFRITLKGTENNYDNMQVRINKTGCAEQILEWDNVDNDDSDIMSALLVIQSMASDAASAAIQGNSRLLVTASAASDCYSLLTITNSRVLLNKSMISDIASVLSDLQSDFQSRVPKAVATNSQLSDLASDLRSVLIVNQSAMSDMISKLSDVESNLLSFLVSPGVQLNPSTMSDLRSAMAAVTVTLTTSDISDIASAVAAAVTTITTSDISDIASRVDAVLASRLSDILSAAQQTNSRVLVIQSMASDLASKLSDVESNMLSFLLSPGVQLNASSLSDLRSAITAGGGGGGGTVTGSDISDIASAVADVLASRLSDILSAAQQTNSRALVAVSSLSDIYSGLTAGVTVGASSLSDIRSVVVEHGVLRVGSDPTTVPAVNATLAAKVDFITALGRNKMTLSKTTGEATLFADDGTTAIGSRIDSDNSVVYTRGEVG